MWLEIRSDDSDKQNICELVDIHRQMSQEEAEDLSEI